MAQSGKIAVIGDKDSVLAFKAVGMEAHVANTPFEANDLLRALRDDCAVIFITEQLCAQIPDTLARLKTRPYPAVIPIPGAEGSNGFGVEGIHKDIERAIGADILL